MRETDQHTEDQWHEHRRIIERFRTAFVEGEISTDEKRRLIADENARYYGPSDRLARCRQGASPDDSGRQRRAGR